MTIVVITVLALLVAYFFIAKRKSTVEYPVKLGHSAGNANRKPTNRSIAPRSRWRATSIVREENSCDAVKAIAKKQFLDTERALPKLPLPECDVAVCNCKYVHSDDRRYTDEDRRTPNTLKAQLYEQTGQVNQRSRKRGRRKSDWA